MQEKLITSYFGRMLQSSDRRFVARGLCELFRNVCISLIIFLTIPARQL